MECMSKPGLSLCKTGYAAGSGNLNVNIEHIAGRCVPFHVILYQGVTGKRQLQLLPRAPAGANLLCHDCGGKPWEFCRGSSLV